MSTGSGTFHAGPSEVDSHDGYTYDPFSWEDNTTTTFVARQSSIARLSAARSGLYVTVEGRARFYSVDAGEWASVTGRYLVLQKRPATGTKWTTVARAWINSTTRVAAFPRQYSPRAAHWRVIFHGTVRTWASTSASLLK